MRRRLRFGPHFAPYTHAAMAAVLSVLTLQCDAPGPYYNYLGVESVNLAANQPNGPGALVTTVYACSPARSAGLHVGDIIMAVGDQAVDGESLTKVIRELPLYSKITLGVVRADKPLKFRAELWRASAAVYPSAAPYFGVGSWTNEDGSVIVSCICSNSPAERAGILVGDNLAAINGEYINASNYHAVLTKFDAGNTVSVTVLRNNVARTVSVQFTDDEPPNERLDVKNIKVLDETVERVIDVEEVPLNNCAGNSTLESHRSFSKKVTRQMSLNVDGELQAFGATPFMLAQIRLAAKYDYNSSDELSESKTEIMRAAPRTFVTYVVTWYEISNKGLVELSVNGKSHAAPFEVTQRLRVQTRAGSETPCV